MRDVSVGVGVLAAAGQRDDVVNVKIGWVAAQSTDAANASVAVPKNLRLN